MEDHVPQGSPYGGSPPPGSPPPGRAPADTTSGRRTFSAMLAAILVAGTVGGAAGSAITAASLGRGVLAPETVAAAPSGATNAAVSDPGNLKAIYRQVAPSVVSIQTASALPVRRGTPRLPGSATPGPQGQQGQSPLVPRGEGSGVIIDGEGHILTNYHVVDGASRVTVVLVDGTRVGANVVGTAPDTDLALLKADIPAGKGGVATIGDSDAIEPGDLAVAIGNPFGFEHTITAGIVSAIDRDFGQAAGRPMRGLIQTDAAINPGNSGGPLLNAAGEVIGITTAIESPVEANVGIGFAIPSNLIKGLLDELKAGQTVQHAWLGISGVVLDPQVAADAGLPSDVTQGVLIASVSPDSPAARAGLRAGTPGEGTTPGSQARGGDVILAIDGRQVREVRDISSYLDTKQPGDTVTLTIWRNGSRQDVRATLAPWPTVSQR
ncbi:MAG TPA: trypsin-like peptidase domain-containing protein [Chloroflexota bacterium]|nr:trypsin-like peptidase domain-containing protein [Chloroflexota bacterium]